MDVGGICEKEELIHVLLAARTSQQEASASGSRSAPQPPPQPEYKESKPEPELPKELQGPWYRINGSRMEIMGQNIFWQDGSVAKIWPQGDNKFNVILEGRAYHAKLSGDKIVWSDGDIWTQTPPPQPKPQAKAPIAKGNINRSQALACLDLSGDPGDEEIRKAYKKAALRWHPDRRQNHDCADAAKEKFQEVRAAFEYLTERR